MTSFPRFDEYTTPPKTNMVIPTWWFGSGESSFKYSYLGYLCWFFWVADLTTWKTAATVAMNFTISSCVLWNFKSKYQSIIGIPGAPTRMAEWGDRAWGCHLGLWKGRIPNTGWVFKSKWRIVDESGYDACDVWCWMVMVLVDSIYIYIYTHIYSS